MIIDTLDKYRTVFKRYIDVAFNGFHLGLFDDKDSLDTLLNDKSKLPLVILINLYYYLYYIFVTVNITH